MLSFDPMPGPDDELPDDALPNDGPSDDDLPDGEQPGDELFDEDLPDELPTGELPPGALPAVDEPLLAEGAPYEVFDGVLVAVPPAEEPHAERHASVGALVSAHVQPAFTVALDMKTRVDALSEVAPDVSVYPRERDPATGGRRLEHVAFDVVGTETLSHAGKRALKLVTRGVRRVLAIDVSRDRVLEWAHEPAEWTELARDAQIADPVFSSPLSIASLLRVAAIDDDVARALLAKENAVIAAALEASHAAGQVASVIAILTARGIALDDAARDQIRAEADRDRLGRWVVQAISCTSAAALLAVP